MSEQKSHLSDENLFLLQSILKQYNIEIEEEDVQKLKDEMERKVIIAKHKEFSNIWQGKNGRWYTYLPSENGRKQIAKSTEEKLNKVIFKHYYESNQENQKKLVTLRTFYQTWLDYKSLHTNASSYIRKIDTDWRIHYLDNPIIDIPLVKLNYTTLDTWSHGMIKEQGLTKTKYYNISVIMRQALQYAVDIGVINESPFERVKIKTKMFKPSKKKPDATQVFLEDEKPLIIAEALKDFETTGKVAPLGIILCFEIGARCGEMVGLKFSDVNENFIRIQRQEVRDYPNGTRKPAVYKVVEYVKTEAGIRNTYLTEYARYLIGLIKDSNQNNGYFDDNYMFVDKNGRLHTRAFDRHLRKYCRKIGIQAKSTHKIRKTYISTLFDADLNLNAIREQVGHADEQTTLRSYVYNRKTDEQTQSIIENALKQKCNQM